MKESGVGRKDTKRRASMRARAKAGGQQTVSTLRWKVLSEKRGLAG